MPETLCFRCVNEGKPFPAKDLPKLPPRAVNVVAEALRAREADPNSDPAAFELDLAISLVWLVVRRMTPNCDLKREVIETEEDADMVLQAYQVVKANNPFFFSAPEPAASPASA